MARYTIKNAYKVESDIFKYCDVQKLDGAKLRDSLTYLLNYFELDSKLETKMFYKEAQSAIFKIGNSTGICSPQKVADYTEAIEDWPEAFVNVTSAITNGIYVGLGMKIPTKKLENGFEPLDVAIESWELVYMYYWACFCLLILILICFLFLIRRHRVDLFDFTSIISRFIVLGVGGALLGLFADKARLYQALSTPMLLPICVILLFLILVVDKLSAIWCNWRLKKSGQPYALEVEEHGHGGGHDAHAHDEAHGEVHERAPLQGHSHHDSVNLEDARKSAHYSMYSDVKPMAETHTEYIGGHGYADESTTYEPRPYHTGVGHSACWPRRIHAGQHWAELWCLKRTATILLPGALKMNLLVISVGALHVMTYEIGVLDSDTYACCNILALV
jgi:hypothetical protein